MSELDLDAIERASETCGLAVMLANLLRVTDHCRRLREELATVEGELADVLRDADSRCIEMLDTSAERDVLLARAEAAEAALLGSLQTHRTTDREKHTALARAEAAEAKVVVMREALDTATSLLDDAQSSGWCEDAIADGQWASVEEWQVKAAACVESAARDFALDSTQEDTK